MHGKNDADALLGVGGVVLRRETQGGGEVAKGKQGTVQKGTERSEK